MIKANELETQHVYLVSDINSNGRKRKARYIGTVSSYGDQIGPDEFIPTQRFTFEFQDKKGGLAVLEVEEELYLRGEAVLEDVS